MASSRADTGSSRRAHGCCGATTTTSWSSAITQRPPEQRRCGVWVVDTRSGQTIAFLQFEARVQEVFAVQLLPGMRYPDVLTEEHPEVANAFLVPDDAMADVAGPKS